MGTHKFEIEVDDDNVEGFFDVVNVMKRESIRQNSFELAATLRELERTIREDYDVELTVGEGLEAEQSGQRLQDWIDLTDKLFPEGFEPVIQTTEVSGKTYRRMAITDPDDKIVHYSTNTTDIESVIIDTLQFYVGLGVEKRSEYVSDFESEIQEYYEQDEEE